MRVFRLIFVLVLTLALFPWGAYAKVQSAGQAGISGVARVEDPAVLAVQPVVTPPQRGHGPALPGSACAPVFAVLPPDADLPRLLQRRGLVPGSMLWRQGRETPPPLGPPIL